MGQPYQGCPRHRGDPGLPSCSFGKGCRESQKETGRDEEKREEEEEEEEAEEASSSTNVNYRGKKKEAEVQVHQKSCFGKGSRKCFGKSKR